MRKLLFRKHPRAEEGAAVVEFAFALPVLIMFIWGIGQFGMIMAADAGMQHALGEGARAATLFPTPNDATIKQRMQDTVFGNYLGSYTINDPVNSGSAAAGNRFITLTVSYTVTPDFLFFRTAPITFTRSKRVYITETVAS